MKKKFEKERIQLEIKMKEKEKALEEQKKKMEEEIERQLKSQLDKEKQAQQLREIDQKLQELVPKINEANIICRELKRETIMYKPDIVTEVNADGSRTSKVQVKVYQDRNNEDTASMIPYDIFMDEIYFKVKEMYDEKEHAGFIEIEGDRSNDDETFGWSLAEQWIPIGIVFQYLQSIYYLLDVSDEQNIYDSKGLQVGKLQVQMNIKLFDTDKKTQLNLIDYEDMEELLSKWV